MTRIILAAALALLATPAVARQAITIPIEMRGSWCDDPANPYPNPIQPKTREYLECDKLYALGVTATGYHNTEDRTCKATKIVPFNIYRKGIVNPWGQGLRITFRCMEEDGRPFTLIEEWQIRKGYLMVNESPASKVRR